MTLYEHLKLMPQGEELTVWDNDYDMETYFYSDFDKEDNKWQVGMLELAKLLTIKKINKRGVTVDLSAIIENKIDELDKADLFIECDIDEIMYDMDNILAGCVSEEWLLKFVSVLKADK